MYKKYLFTAFQAFLLIASTSTYAADNKNHSIEEKFVIKDLNKDSFLTADEAKKWKKVEKNFSTIDLNGDKKISLEEIKEFTKK